MTSEPIGSDSDADDELRERVLAILPSGAATLFHEIEKHSGKRVGFKKYSYPVHPDSYNQTPCATELSCTAADILLSNLESPDPHGVTHEILHLHRHWVQSVPRFFPASPSPQNQSNCNSFENAIEHLVIVPKESGFGFDRSYWNGALAHHAKSYPWPLQTDPIGRRRHGLLLRMAAELATDETLKAECDRILVAEKLKYEADLFIGLLRNVLNDKVRAAGCMARFFKLAKGSYVLLQCDVRNNASRRIAIPAH